MTSPVRREMALSLGGVFAGAAVGIVIFFLLAKTGLILLVLPGALTGFGRGLMSSRPSWLMALVSGIAGLAAGVFGLWLILPLKTDTGLLYFVTHIYHVTPVMLGMLAAGALAAAWLGYGRQGRGEAG